MSAQVLAEGKTFDTPQGNTCTGEVVLLCVFFGVFSLSLFFSASEAEGGEIKFWYEPELDQMLFLVNSELTKI